MATPTPKRRSGGIAWYPLCVNLTPDQKEKLFELAERDGQRTVNSLVRSWIEEKVSEREAA